MDWFSSYLAYWIPGIFVFIIIVLFLVYLSLKAYYSKVTTGEEGIIGEKGVYQGNDLVLVHGELWRVNDPGKLEKGDKIEVIDVDRLVLRVRKI